MFYKTTLLYENNVTTRSMLSIDNGKEFVGECI